MISLFGREEFDPPRNAMKDPLTALKLSSFWIFLSVLWIALSMERVSHLRASGRQVGGWGEARVWVWVVISLFWSWNAWTNFRKYQRDRR